MRKYKREKGEKIEKEIREKKNVVVEWEMRYGKN